MIVLLILPVVGRLSRGSTMSSPAAVAQPSFMGKLSDWLVSCLTSIVDFTRTIMSPITSAASLAIDGLGYYLKATAYFDSFINILNGRVDPKNKAIFITGKCD